MPELLPKIAELSEKLRKDPASRLFVPLAEEYVKAGMLDEAIQVLTDGLKRYPDFLSARVTLGKIYFQQAKFAESRRELELAIKTNPDNIIALRILAVLYRQSKLWDQAKRCCDAVLAANPKDAETKQLLTEIEAALAKQEVAELSISSPDLNVSHRSAAEEVFEISGEPPPGMSSPPSTPAPMAPPQAPPSSSPPQPPPSRPTARAAEPPPRPAAPPAQTSPVERRGDEEAPEELVSPTLAQLYFRQGHYEQAVRVYDELLRREPQNEAYRQAHKMAFTLMQGQQSQVKPASSAQSATPASAGPGDGDHRPPNAQAIKRLQSWLFNIQQRRRRAV